MKSLLKIIFTITLIMSSFLRVYANESYNYAHPSINGKLHVQGSQLVDQTNNPVQLKGLSTHGITWFPQYVNQDYFYELRHEWNANVVRLALYTAEYNGYCEGGNQNDLKNLVKTGIQLATNNDLYVIVDWHILHDLTPKKYENDAISFFDEISREYAGYNNILYEICNEPNGNTTWQEVKEYAEKVIPVIRNNDPNALIIVGTPNWSQDINEAYNNPLAFDNVMYALHFYAATHTDWLRNRMTSMISNGLPVFVSEFGICTSDGNGYIDYEQSAKWIDTMNAYGVSYCMWNISNNYETSAIFNTGCQKTSGFTQDDLTASGKWIYELLTSQKQEEISATIKGYSLSLSGQIGIHFYVDLNEKAKESRPSMHFDNNQIITFDQALDKDGMVVYTCWIPFKEMTRPVTGNLMIQDQVIQTFTYSASDYASFIKNHPENYQKELKVVKAMLTCGYYTQQYFNYNVDLLSSIQNDINPLSNVDFKNYAYKETKSDDIQFVGARLVLTSLPKIKFYFLQDGNYTVNGQAVQTTKENNYTVITISDIRNMNEMFTIKNKDYKLEYGVFSYANQVKDAPLKNLVTALFAYQNEISAYQN